MSLWIIATFIFIGSGSADAQCSTSGRFVNELASECRGYTTCIAAGTATYQYDLSCPPGFIYHHLDKQCTNATAYRCLPAAVCSAAGLYPDPNATDCTSYIACIQGLTTISARLIDCPSNHLFNPADQLCVGAGQYTCPLTLTTTPVTPRSSISYVTTVNPNSVSSGPSISDVTTVKPNSASSNAVVGYMAMLTIVVRIAMM